ncbi:MAG TPA: beta-ketoacyl synthase N-terminal-like domain-containing protein, partial [Pyrinomonadaceae bacterium]|nr:beta-ketoacyl synthase N-terminal-like domain-containing protein [Pyrinomonadaceae bacterium]
MTIAIDGIGLATAQGGVSDVLRSDVPRAATELPWTPADWSVSRVCFPAAEVDALLSGVARWQELARRALIDIGVSEQTPLLVASCNGSAADVWENAFDTSALLAGTAWANERLPVFSSSCASGIHALYAGRQLLTSGAVDEVLVLAVDILARSNHENFESLRVLAERPCEPWQSASTGFVLGEAAVVVRLVRAKEDATILHGPVLGSDLVEHDALRVVLEQVSAQNASLILGQGTGPFAVDSAELAALSAFVDKKVPISTPLTQFGHTLGASGLLVVALGALIHQNGSLPNPTSETTDGRTYCRGGPPWPP